MEIESNTTTVLLGAQIKAARGVLGMTQEEAAKKAGLSISTIARLERTPPVRLSPRLLRKLARLRLRLEAQAAAKLAAEVA